MMVRHIDRQLCCTPTTVHARTDNNQATAEFQHVDRSNWVRCGRPPPLLWALQTHTQLSACIQKTHTSIHRHVGEMTEAQYHKVADHTLDLLTEKLEVRGWVLVGGSAGVSYHMCTIVSCMFCLNPFLIIVPCVIICLNQYVVYIVPRSVCSVWSTILIIIMTGAGGTSRHG